MPAATSSTKTRTGQGDQTRRALLDAAVDRFGRDGLRATSIASISRQAGLGRTTVFSHYPNKKALFLAAVEDDLNACFDQVLTDVEVSSPDPAWFATAMATLNATLPDHPLAARLLAGLEPEAARSMFEGATMERFRTAVVARLEVSRERGTLHSDVDTESAADGILAIVLGATMARSQYGDAIDELQQGVGHLLQLIFEQRPTD